jgi:hypothetical protein
MSDTFNHKGQCRKLRQAGLPENVFLQSNLHHGNPRKAIRTAKKEVSKQKKAKQKVDLFKLYTNSISEYMKSPHADESDPCVDPDGNLDFGGEDGEGW